MFNKRVNLPYAIYCSSEYCKVLHAVQVRLIYGINFL